MKCAEKDCNGQIDYERMFPIRTGCMTASPAYPCNVCGRLYFRNGFKVFNRGGDAIFAVDNEIVNVPQPQK